MAKKKVSKKNVGNGFGIASFVLALASIPTMIFFGLGILLALLAIIFGIIQLVKKSSWQAIVGLVLGILVLLILPAIVIVWQVVNTTVRGGAEALGNSSIPEAFLSLILN